MQLAFMPIPGSINPAAARSAAMREIGRSYITTGSGELDFMVTVELPDYSPQFGRAKASICKTAREHGFQLEDDYRSPEWVRHLQPITEQYYESSR